MKIAVCDDDSVQLNFTCNLLENYFAEKDAGNADTRIFPFASGETFLNEFFAGKYEIIFLDIDMPGLNGMDLAKLIRRVDMAVQIVFVTCMENYALQGYEVMPAGFIVKPCKPENIRKVMDQLLLKLSPAEADFYHVQPKGGGAVRLLTREIFYIESHLHYVTAVTAGDKACEYLSTMNDEEKKLAPRGFIRIHQSYLVNRAHVWIVRKNYVKLTTGKELPVSRKYEKRVEEFK